MEKIITAKKVNKIFKKGKTKIYAVNEAEITIQKGERVFIYGPSGAGKSTLLQILGGLNKPTSGNVIFDNRDLYGMSDAKRSKVRNISFGFIFQFYYLLPELNVIENVMMPGRIKGGISNKDLTKRAENLLSVVEMSDRKKHKPGELSGGEAQRVAIARALVNSPDVLFCDEPTGNLDSKLKKEINELIYHISSLNSMSVVMVSHEEINKNFFDKEYLMVDGVIEEMKEMWRPDPWKMRGSNES